MDKEEIKNLLYALHHSSYRNEQQIKNSKDCGCYVKDVGLLPPLYYHKPKSVIRISLCRTAKRNPLIFPI